MSGTVLLLRGTDWFLDGARDLACLPGVSVLLAGLEPEEMLTATLASVRGAPALTVGNVVGINVTRSSSAQLDESVAGNNVSLFRAQKGKHERYGSISEIGASSVRADPVSEPYHSRPHDADVKFFDGVYAYEHIPGAKRY